MYTQTCTSSSPSTYTSAYTCTYAVAHTRRYMTICSVHVHVHVYMYMYMYNDAPVGHALGTLGVLVRPEELYDRQQHAQQVGRPDWHLLSSKAHRQPAEAVEEAKEDLQCRQRLPGLSLKKTGNKNHAGWHSHHQQHGGSKKNDTHINKAQTTVFGNIPHIRTWVTHRQPNSPPTKILNHWCLYKLCCCSFSKF